MYRMDFTSPSFHSTFHSTFQLIFQATHLPHVSEAKYLGPTLDQYLNFNKHIDIICKKANTSSGEILTSVATVSKQMPTKHTYYIYCSWNMLYSFGHHTQPLILINQKVFKEGLLACSYVMSNYDHHSSVIWSELQGRQKAQINSIYILNNMVDVYLPNCVTSCQILDRSHSKEFTPTSLRIDTYKFSFFLRVLTLWNGLPSNIVLLAQTYEQFQDSLHKLFNIK